MKGPAHGIHLDGLGCLTTTEPYWLPRELVLQSCISMQAVAFATTLRCNAQEQAGKMLLMRHARSKGSNTVV
eukprot:1078078-Amphidinium_carterae.2